LVGLPTISAQRIDVVQAFFDGCFGACGDLGCPAADGAMLEASRGIGGATVVNPKPNQPED
jgi:hypothetical protein